MLKSLGAVLLKLRVRYTQKEYERLKYLFWRGTSDTLIVSFSGFAGDGPARYNYMNTLQGLKANKLFILDDFGYKKQGSYYLGENGEWFLPDMVCALIRRIRTENHIKRLIMIGSSKGGTAALFYAIQMGADACIIGAPQYFIGDYLSIDRHLPILEGLMGDTTPASVHKLNQVIRDQVCSAGSPKRPKVYIHCSPLEHTYTEHVADMICDLKGKGYSVEEDIQYQYTEHKEVARFFPPYLVKTLKDIL